jgi:hypothetical protein
VSFAPADAYACWGPRHDSDRNLASELDPFKQYQHSPARFMADDGLEVRIPAYTHHVYDCIAAARAQGLRLANLQEWWHA